ncbi:MAG: DsrE family protein [Chitinophaga sp.]|uniref:DsrE family protein n=1 Tax=Chitinophaga sp. TaxID=1869181 RepID=UPI0025C37AB6|nr:DsrE family protein [Chitinophaga sp.]MBV8251453.1 DsrE family protein [Chitinophaga sp.]
MQVVFQITSTAEDAHKAMLGQLHNLLDYCRNQHKDIRIEVVVHGQAYGLLLRAEGPLVLRVQALAEQGVRWLICRNTLNGNDIKDSMLFPFVEVVPAGIAHLVERQQEGWAYIRC